MDWLTDPYAYGFMQRALIASVLVGLVAPLVGVWIVLRRLAYLGDAMSHATLGGVAVAYLAGASVTLGAAGAGLAMAGLIAGALVALAVLFDDLRCATFDVQHARMAGVPVRAVDTALLVLLAVTVVLALQTVGVLMAIALFVVPAAAARLWTQTAEAMSALAALLGLAAALGGLHLAYHLATPPGATVALVAVALLGASVAATLPRRARRPAAHAAELPGAR